MASRSKSGDTFIKLSLEDKEVLTGLERVQARMQRVGASMSKIGGFATAAGAAVVSAFVKPVQAASEMEEAVNKFNVVFGKNKQNSLCYESWGLFQLLLILNSLFGGMNVTDFP